MAHDTLLATLGALAASLGSAMALLAAFALYRLTSIASQMQSDALNITEATGRFRGQQEYEQLILLVSAEDWDQFLPLISAIRGARGDSAIDVVTRGRLARLPEAYRQQRVIFAALWIALMLTAVVMAGALAALAYADRICVPPWTPVVGVAACLLSYLNLIWLSLRHRGHAFS